MNIHQYSREVLIFNEKLVLPGLGTIRIEKASASAQGGKFSPGESKLVFDKSQSMDDEVLSSKLEAAEEISTDEARQKVMEFVDEIRFSLDKGESYEIKGICILSLNEDSEIVIKKHSDFDLDFDNYGLQSFELDEFLDEESSLSNVDDDPLPDEKEEKTVEEAEENTVNFEEEKKTNPEEEKEKITPEPVYNPNTEPVGMPVRERKSRGTFWIVFGLVVIVALAAVLIPVKLDLFDKNPDREDIFQNDAFGENENVNESQTSDEFDEMKKELDEEIDSVTSIHNALKPREEKPAVDLSVPPGYVEYHIIAGSFQDLDNARDLQKSLMLAGYPSKILEPGKGIFRVSAISYTDKPTALIKLVEFRDKAGLPEAWLMNLE